MLSNSQDNLLLLRNPDDTSSELSAGWPRQPGCLGPEGTRGEEPERQTNSKDNLLLLRNPDDTSSGPPEPVRRPARLIRQSVCASVVCIILAMIVNTWLVEGLWAPVIVASGSMAPHLLGPHRHWECRDCGRGFDCLEESLPGAGAEAVCPNCGAGNLNEAGIDRGGTRVWIDRFSTVWRPISRWETVALRNPQDPDMLCVKRVVGLPGETVQLADGNVVINGRISRKTIVQQVAMAVPVYETSIARKSHAEPSQRWQPDSQGHWIETDGRLVYHNASASTDNASDDSADAIDWLTYRHRQPFATTHRPDAPAILDASPCDQSESRLLNQVSDIIVRCQLRAQSPGLFYVRARMGGDEFVAEVDMTANRCTLIHNGMRQTATAIFRSPLNRLVQLDFVLADHQLQLAMDDRVLTEYCYVPKAAENGDGIQDIAIGARTAKLEIDRLQILRDVYYLPPGNQKNRTFQLGPNQFFVLGDNSPHSSDSREWPRHVAAGSIVGRVVSW